MQKTQQLDHKQKQLVENYVRYLDKFGPEYDRLVVAQGKDPGITFGVDKFIENCHTLCSDKALNLLDLGQDYLEDGHWKHSRDVYAKPALEGKGYWIKPENFVDVTKGKTLFDDYRYDQLGYIVIA